VKDESEHVTFVNALREFLDLRPLRWESEYGSRVESDLRRFGGAPVYNWPMFGSSKAGKVDVT
jgi:hypothetical protein